MPFVCHSSPLCALFLLLLLPPPSRTLLFHPIFILIFYSPPFCDASRFFRHSRLSLLALSALSLPPCSSVKRFASFLFLPVILSLFNPPLNSLIRVTCKRNVQQKGGCVVVHPYLLLFVSQTNTNAFPYRLIQLRVHLSSLGPQSSVSFPSFLFPFFFYLRVRRVSSSFFFYNFSYRKESGKKSLLVSKVKIWKGVKRKIWGEGG